MLKSEDYLRDLVTIFFIQKRIILWTTILAAIVAVLVYLFWPRTYEITGSILVKSKNVQKSPDAIEDTFTSIRPVSREDLIQEQTMLTSYDVVSRTVQSLHDQGAAYHNTPMTPDRLKELTLDIKGRLSADIIPESNIIKARLQSRDPDQALEVLNEILRNYIVFRSGIVQPNRAQPFFQNQAQKFDVEIMGIEDQLIDLAKRAQTADPELEISNNIQTKQALDQMLVEIENQRIEQERLVNHLKRSIDTNSLQFFSSIENRAIADLAFKLQDLYIEQGTMARVYSQESTKVERIQEQIDKTSRTLKQEVASYTANEENKLRIAEEKIATLKTTIQELVQRNIDLQNFLVQKQRLERQLLLLQQSYTTFALRGKEAGVSQSSEQNALFSISVIDPPFFPGFATFPTKKLIPVGIIIGFITGCCLGFVKEFFDHTIKRPEDVANFNDLATLFSIPKGV